MSLRSFPADQYGREVYWNNLGADIGPLLVAAGNPGALMMNLGLITFRPVRHWIEISLGLRCNADAMQLIFQTYDRTAGSPGVAQSSPLWAIALGAAHAFAWHGIGYFTPTTGQRNIDLRWSSNGGNWEVLSASLYNGKIRICEAPDNRQLPMNTGY